VEGECGDGERRQGLSHQVEAQAAPGKPTMDGFCYWLMVSMATVVLPFLFLLDRGPPGQSKSLVSMFLNTLLIGGIQRCAREGGHVVSRHGSTVDRCGGIVDRLATCFHYPTHAQQG